MKTAAMAMAVLIAALFAMASPYEWTVWGCYERMPLIGHVDKKVTYKCKFCGWTKTFTWDEAFWKNEDEPVLMKHVWTFHVDDIRKDGTTNIMPSTVTGSVWLVISAVRWETNTTTNVMEISDAVVGCSLWPMICAVYGCDHKQPRPATWREVRRVVTETRTVIIRADGEERRYVWSEKTLSDTTVRYGVKQPEWQIERTWTNTPWNISATNVGFGNGVLVGSNILWRGL